MIPVLNKKTHGMPKGSMYCGRPSILGNPFVIGRDGDRAAVIAKYRTWFYERCETPPFQEALSRAEKATWLVCWCAPESCHCDVIAEYLEKRKGTKDGKAT